MTDPHPPSAPPPGPDEPLSDVEERVLDLVDGLVADDATPSDPAVASAVEAQRQARDAVAAPVEASSLVRQRALRAALAEHRRAAGAFAEDDERAPSASPTRIDSRARSRVGRWALTVAGAAAALVLFAGVVTLMTRAGTRSETATSTAAGGQPVSGTATPAAPGATVDFGAVEDPTQLLDRVVVIVGGSKNAGGSTNEDFSTQRSAGQGAADAASATVAPNAASVPPTPSGAPTAGANSQSGAGTPPTTATLQTLASCEPAARSAVPGLGAGTVLVTGPVRYQGIAATVYVFGDVGGSARQVVTMSDGDCRVLVSAPL